MDVFRYFFVFCFSDLYVGSNFEHTNVISDGWKVHGGTHDFKTKKQRKNHTNADSQSFFAIAIRPFHIHLRSTAQQIRQLSDSGRWPYTMNQPWNCGNEGSIKKKVKQTSMMLMMVMTTTGNDVDN